MRNYSAVANSSNGITNQVNFQFDALYKQFNDTFNTIKRKL
jgi:hypothetical protein